MATGGGDNQNLWGANCPWLTDRMTEVIEETARKLNVPPPEVLERVKGGLEVAPSEVGDRTAEEINKGVWAVINAIREEADAKEPEVRLEDATQSTSNLDNPVALLEIVMGAMEEVTRCREADDPKGAATAVDVMLGECNLFRHLLANLASAQQ